MIDWLFGKKRTKNIFGKCRHNNTVIMNDVTYACLDCEKINAGDWWFDPSQLIHWDNLSEYRQMLAEKRA